MEDDQRESENGGNDQTLAVERLSQDDIAAMRAARTLAGHLTRCGQQFAEGHQREAAMQSLASVLDFLKAAGASHEQRAPLAALLFQLMDLNNGAVGGLLEPNSERRNNRPKDGDPVWAARAALAAAYKIRTCQVMDIEGRRLTAADLNAVAKKVISDFGPVDSVRGERTKGRTPEGWLRGQSSNFSQAKDCGPRDGPQMDVWNELSRLADGAAQAASPKGHRQGYEAAYQTAIDTARHCTELARVKPHS